MKIIFFRKIIGCMSFLKIKIENNKVFIEYIIEDKKVLEKPVSIWLDLKDIENYEGIERYEVKNGVIYLDLTDLKEYKEMIFSLKNKKADNPLDRYNQSEYVNPILPSTLSSQKKAWLTRGKKKVKKPEIEKVKVIGGKLTIGAFHILASKLRKNPYMYLSVDEIKRYRIEQGVIYRASFLNIKTKKVEKILTCKAFLFDEEQGLVRMSFESRWLSFFADKGIYMRDPDDYVLFIEVSDYIRTQERIQDRMVINKNILEVDKTFVEARGIKNKACSDLIKLMLE